MAPSRAEAHRLIKAEGIYVAAAPGDQKRSLLPGNLDWTPAKLWFPGEVQRYIIDDKIFILRRGKHHVRIIEILSEAEFEATGKKYPGQPYTGKVRGMISEVMEQAAAQGVHLDQKDLRRKLYEMEKRERLAKLRPGKMEEKLSTGSSKLVNSSSVNEDRRPGKDWGEKDWSGKENKDPGGKKDEGKDEDW
jgi:tyrosyl-tRNA synthetase